MTIILSFNLNTYLFILCVCWTVGQSQVCTLEDARAQVVVICFLVMFRLFALMIPRSWSVLLPNQRQNSPLAYNLWFAKRLIVLRRENIFLPSNLVLLIGRLCWCAE